MFFLIIYLLHPIGFEPIYNCFEGKRFPYLAKDVTDF